MTESKESLGQQLFNAVYDVLTKKIPIETIEKLLNSGAPIDFQEEEGTTPLMLAAMYKGGGGEKVCELLLKHGASIDIGDVVKDTALMLAASQGSLECVKTLLDHGSRTDLQNEEGDIALSLACKRCDTEDAGIAIVKLLCKEGVVDPQERLDALIKATKDNNKTRISALISCACNKKESITCKRCSEQFIKNAKTDLAYKERMLEEAKESVVAAKAHLQTLVKKSAEWELQRAQKSIEFTRERLRREEENLILLKDKAAEAKGEEKSSEDEVSKSGKSEKILVFAPH